MAINARAQGALEYVVLFVVLIAAFLVAERFVNKSVRGRMKQAQEEINLNAK